MKLRKWIKQKMCKHENKIVVKKNLRLINTGMCKEITTTYRCPECGREWCKVNIV